MAVKKFNILKMNTSSWWVIYK